MTANLLIIAFNIMLSYTSVLGGYGYSTENKEELKLLVFRDANGLTIWN